MTDWSRSTRTARRSVAGAAAVLALALLATSCSSGQAAAPGAVQPSSAPSSSSDGPTAGSESAATSRFPSYVALGDSYTAAPGVPDTDTADGCLRSSNNYPALVAAAMPGTALTDVSCTGADSTSLIGVQDTGREAKPAQFDALSEQTDLVTVGIGGNDNDLFGTLVGVCSQLRDSDPDGNPCEQRFAGDGTNRLDRDLRTIRSHVTAVVAGIKDRAPNARVVVVGYPQILPPSGSCPELLPLASGDYPFAREINEGLGDAVKRAAAAGDAEYVDMFRASAGHDICSEDPWVNGIVTNSRALAFHPFAAEQQAVADRVLALVSD